MANVEIYGNREVVFAKEETSRRLAVGGSTIEAVAGLAAVVLAILGLAGVMRAYLAPIATIVVGCAILFEGGSTAARWSRLLAAPGRAVETDMEIGGAGAEIFGGVAGIVLGVLALIGISPGVLIAAAVVVYGATLLLGSSASSRLAALAASMRAPIEHPEIARDVIVATSGAQLLTSLGAIVLGIVALVGIAQPVLSMVALLALGTAVLMTGSAVGGTIFSFGAPLQNRAS